MPKIRKQFSTNTVIQGNIRCEYFGSLCDKKMGTHLEYNILPNKFRCIVYNVQIGHFEQRTKLHCEVCTTPILSYPCSFCNYEPLVLEKQTLYFEKIENAKFIEQSTISADATYSIQNLEKVKITVERHSHVNHTSNITQGIIIGTFTATLNFEEPEPEQTTEPEQITESLSSDSTGESPVSTKSNVPNSQNVRTGTNAPATNDGLPAASDVGIPQTNTISSKDGENTNDSSTETFSDEDKSINNLDLTEEEEILKDPPSKSVLIKLLSLLGILLALGIIALTGGIWWGPLSIFLASIWATRFLREYFLHYSNPFGGRLKRWSKKLEWTSTLISLGIIVFLLFLGICTPEDFIGYIIVITSIVCIFTYQTYPLILVSIASIIMYSSNYPAICPENTAEFIDELADQIRDSDDDSIVDAYDKCVDTPEDFDGVEDEDGCPDEDNDQDGVPDIIDDCINVPGHGLDGCPNERDLANLDDDEDGVSNLLDKCPEEKEVYNHFNDSDGCADELPQELQDISGILNLHFDLNTAKLQIEDEYTKNILNKLAVALVKFPQLRMRIDGHTDDRGPERFNQQLSEKRGESTKKHLVEQGILSSRIQVRGYGSSKPLVPNFSEENQAKNRRVDISYYGEVDLLPPLEKNLPKKDTEEQLDMNNIDKSSVQEIKQQDSGKEADE